MPITNAELANPTVLPVLTVPTAQPVTLPSGSMELIVPVAMLLVLTA